MGDTKDLENRHVANTSDKWPITVQSNREIIKPGKIISIEGVDTQVVRKILLHTSYDGNESKLDLNTVHYNKVIDKFNIVWESFSSIFPISNNISFFVGAEGKEVSMFAVCEYFSSETWNPVASLILNPNIPIEVDRNIIKEFVELTLNHLNSFLEGSSEFLFYDAILLRQYVYEYETLRLMDIDPVFVTKDLNAVLKIQIIKRISIYFSELNKIIAKGYFDDEIEKLDSIEKTRLRCQNWLFGIE